MGGEWINIHNYVYLIWLQVLYLSNVAIIYWQMICLYIIEQLLKWISIYKYYVYKYFWLDLTISVTIPRLTILTSLPDLRWDLELDNHASSRKSHWDLNYGQYIDSLYLVYKFKFYSKVWKSKGSNTKQLSQRDFNIIPRSNSSLSLNWILNNGFIIFWTCFLGQEWSMNSEAIFAICCFHSFLLQFVAINII